MAKLKDRFVTVQLTLLSIVVALVLEGLLGTLMAQPQWSAVTVIQALDVMASALAMWLGFAYGISTVDKVPHIMDFLAPFGLLISLSLGVRFIGSEPLTAFLLCVAAGSIIAASALWLDCLQASEAGLAGPTRQAKLLTTIGCWELVLAGLSQFTELTAIAVAGLLLVSTLTQIYGVRVTIGAWRFSLREAMAGSSAN